MIKKNQKQPKALYYLFGTELWERNGFYVLQSLLVLFLTGHFLLSQKQANNTYGEFTTLVYMLPLLGGWLVDQFVGYRRCIFSGAFLLFLGYVLIAFMGYQITLLGMSCIILGNGLLKSNISSFLGEFYQVGDVRREAGFTFFYIGINLGSLLATQSSGFIQRYLGWSACFWFAASGLLLAMCVFYFGYKVYGNLGNSGKIDRSGWRRYFFSPIGFSILFLVLLAVCDSLLNFPRIGMGVLNVLGIIALFIMVVKSFSLGVSERCRLWLLLILVLGSIVFWGLFFQLFSSLIFYTQALVDKNILGINFPVNAFTSLEPFFIITFGYVLALFWRYLAMRKLNISYAAKFSLAFFAAAGSFLVLKMAIHWAPGVALIHPIWLVGAFFLLTLGELLLSPLGLSMVTEYSPVKWRGLMMGVWFLSLSYGGEVSSILANIASVPVGLTNVVKIKAIYAHAFSLDVWFAVITGLVLWLVVSVFNRYVFKHSST